MQRMLVQVLACIGLGGGLLYHYVDEQNKITRLRLAIPQLAKEIRDIQEQNTQLQYHIDRFESPENLMQLALRPEFGHLRYPTCKEILTVNSGSLPAFAEPADTALAMQGRQAFSVVGYIQ